MMLRKWRDTYWPQDRELSLPQAAVLLPWFVAVAAIGTLTWDAPHIGWLWVVLVVCLILSSTRNVRLPSGLLITPSYLVTFLMMGVLDHSTCILVGLVDLVALPVPLRARLWNALTASSCTYVGAELFAALREAGTGQDLFQHQVLFDVQFVAAAFGIFMVMLFLGCVLAWLSGFVPELNPSGKYPFMDMARLLPGMAVPGVLAAGLVGIWARWGSAALLAFSVMMGAFMWIAGRALSAEIRGDALQQSKEVLQEHQLGLLAAFGALIEARDPTLGLHAENVASLAVSMAERLGLSEEEIEDVRVAALLHDLGKLSLADGLLRITFRSEERSLSAGELALVSDYPGRGAERLAQIPQFARVSELVRHHRHLGGPNHDGPVPMPADIICMACDYDTLVSAASRQLPVSTSVALRRMGALYRSRNVAALRALEDTVSGRTVGH